ncbi:benzoylformate decarboxylase [Mycobacterium simiae]|uniref:benzoylformate decarboxylase n=1 Tax=Mycobacterium simiae TaxID=1784 RepID=UPI0026393EAB|nr:benzoylformate decarboxylase [Mycobacterium simiae]
MPTVRQRTYEVLRAHGVNTFFGNPGFTELPFLTDFPADFTYYLGLQEAAVVSMADGYAGATGAPVVVNLHNAPGVGNAMGNLKTAYHNKSPLIITCGQQRRDMCIYEPGFFNRDARDLPKPYVKWSYEPQRAQDIPAAFQRAIHIARQEPQGPVFLVLPVDDWDREAEAMPPVIRQVSRRVAPDPQALESAARRIAAATNPCLIAGAAIDRADAWDQMVAVAEKLRAPVYGAPAASRAAFPESHQLFRGALVFDRELLRQWLDGYDLLVVVGAAVFDFDMGGSGPILPDGSDLLLFTDDPEEADRAPAGDAVLGNVKLALASLAESLPAATRTWPKAAPGPAPPDTSDPVQAHALFALLEELRPKDGVIVLEASSHASAMHIRMPITVPHGFFYAGVGGIGNGVPTAVGVQLARPERRVICATGDGAMLYTVQALWTAAQHMARVVVLVLDNAGYAVLKESGDYLGVGHDQPGLDTPGIDLVKLAEGFGVPGIRVERYAGLRNAIEQALAADGPVLLSVKVDPTLRPLLS